jgi:hypothetical protein
MAIGFQQIADRWSTSGSWGASYFGTAPFGGQDFAVVFVPAPQWGSDNLTLTTAQSVSDMVLRRNGQPVSVRPCANWATWRVVYARLTGAEVAALWAFCLARIFYLLPTGDPGITRRVYWTDGVFRPEPVGPDAYSLAFTLEEI